MTGPATGGTERGTRAPSRLTGTQGAVGALLVVLALGLALRLIIAYLLPGSGFGVDLNAFQFWAANLAANGPHGFYDRDFFHDYTPGYLYVLWLIGIVGQVIGGVGVGLIKIPAILADLVIGWLVWSMLLELGARRSLALGAAFVAVVNPISWFDSVVWGQVDSVGVVFLLLGLRDLWRDRPERSAIFAVIAALIKPQLGILIPLVVVVTIRRALWPIRDEQEEGGGERGERRACGDPGRGHPGAPPCLGAPDGPPDPDRDDGSRRRRDDRPAVPAIRVVGPRVLLDRAVPQVGPALAGLRHRVRLPVPHGQRVQSLGADPGRHRQQPRQLGALGV